MYRVLPYKAGSRGASALATAIGGRCLKLRGSTWRPRAADVVINWGSTDVPDLMPATVLNGRGIRSASNKLLFFQAVTAAGEADIIPQFWTDRNAIPPDAYPIVCRTILAGHSGAGIVIADNPESLVQAPLYVRYVKKSQEYRVHVGGDQIIAVQRKARNRDVPDADINWKVRNHANGFIFAREGFVAPDSVLDVARRALACTGLDFGAVDVIFNERGNRALVLEINTAPGLEGQTVEDYANFFRQF